MIKTYDGKTHKRVGGTTGDRLPATGITRPRVLYTATGGETEIDLTQLSPSISYHPGNAQLSIKRSSGGSLISGVDFFEISPTRIGLPGDDPLIAGEIVEIIQEVVYTGVMAAAPRPDAYTETASPGQTNITADFSWPYNFNQTKGIGSVKVYVHGILQTRGVDFNEVDSGQASTNGIQFLDPLDGGENIVILPTYQVVEQQTAASDPQQITNVQKQLGTYSATVEVNTIVVPSTSIQNRAKIPDLANDLKVHFGTDRFSVSGLKYLPSENGTGGRRVFKPDTDDLDLVRFAGSWTTGVPERGFGVRSNTQNDYLEITFYGTGLNLLTASGAGALDIRCSIDGGAEGANVYLTNSAPLHVDSFTQTNNVINITKGLALGIHTAKIRLSVLGTEPFTVYGHEIFCEKSVITVNPGTAYYSGKKYTNQNAVEISHNSNFENQSLTNELSTTGGRVVICLKSNGQVAKLLRGCGNTPKYAELADHSNEEIVKNIHWREFGGSASDGTLRPLRSVSSANNEYHAVLTDGSTGVSGRALGYGAMNDHDYISTTSTGELQFFFIGTGLDLLMVDNTAGSFGFTLMVDGVSEGVQSYTITESGRPVLRKIVSGLPYGMHSVRLTSFTGIQSGVRAISVYAPKKPEIPSGYVELGEYNALGDYQESALPYGFSKGVIGKTALNEVCFFGTGWATNYSTTSMYRRIAAVTGSGTKGLEYNFFGDSFEIEGRTNTTIAPLPHWTVEIDGVPYTGAASTSNGAVWDAPNSAFYPNISQTGRLHITGLTMSHHKVKLTAANLGGWALTVNNVTHRNPVHATATKSGYENIVGPLVGSTSIGDLRNLSTVPEKTRITEATYVNGTFWGEAGTSSTTGTLLNGMIAGIYSRTGKISIDFSGTFKSANDTNGVSVGILINGVLVNQEEGIEKNLAVATRRLTTHMVVDVPEGFNSVHVIFKVTSDTGLITAVAGQRSLIVKDVG
jgi:hypothetical protein